MTGPVVTLPAHAGAATGDAVIPVADVAAAQVAWREVLDELLRGIAHALSNRVATVSAAAYLASAGEPLDATMSAALAAESERLERLLGDLRLLPAPLDPSVDPVILAEVVEHAISLHRHHLALRNVPIEVTAAPTTPPAAVNATAALHVLLVACTALRLAARGDGPGAEDDRAPPAVQLTLDGDAEHVVVRGVVARSRPLGGVASRAAVRYAGACAALLRAQGGSAAFDDPLTTLTLHVPSLMAHRARQP